MEVLPSIPRGGSPGEISLGETLGDSGQTKDFDGGQAGNWAWDGSGMASGRGVLSGFRRLWQGLVSGSARVGV